MENFKKDFVKEFLIPIGIKKYLPMVICCAEVIEETDGNFTIDPLNYKVLINQNLDENGLLHKLKLIASAMEQRLDEFNNSNKPTN